MTTDNAYKEKYDGYLNLLNSSYEEAINTLKNKYGEVVDDYFREKSYNRFLKGEIKSIANGKFQKTKQGLYCHHIYEDSFLNLSNLEYIKDYHYDYEYQKKENLVYCDLIEHLILHALIMVKTNSKYGFPGFQIFIKPMAKEWYLDKKTPKPEWMKKCKERAYLPANYFESLLNEIDERLMVVDEYRKIIIKKREDELKKRREEEKAQLKKEKKDKEEAKYLNISIDEYKNNEKLILYEKEKKEKLLYSLNDLLSFHFLAKNDDKLLFVNDYNKNEILGLLYNIKYHQNNTFDELRKDKLNATKKELAIELIDSIDEVIQKPTNGTYYYVEKDIFKNIYKAINSLMEAYRIYDDFLASFHNFFDKKETMINDYLSDLIKNNLNNYDNDFINSYIAQLNQFSEKISKLHNKI